MNVTTLLTTLTESNTPGGMTSTEIRNISGQETMELFIHVSAESTTPASKHQKLAPAIRFFHFRFRMKVVLPKRMKGYKYD